MHSMPLVAILVAILAFSLAYIIWTKIHVQIWTRSNALAGLRVLLDSHRGRVSFSIQLDIICRAKFAGQLDITAQATTRQHTPILNII